MFENALFGLLVDLAESPGLGCLLPILIELNENLLRNYLWCELLGLLSNSFFQSLGDTAMLVSSTCLIVLDVISSRFLVNTEWNSEGNFSLLDWLFRKFGAVFGLDRNYLWGFCISSLFWCELSLKYLGRIAATLAELGLPDLFAILGCKFSRKSPTYSSISSTESNSGSSGSNSTIFSRCMCSSGVDSGGL